MQDLYQQEGFKPLLSFLRELNKGALENLAVGDLSTEEKRLKQARYQRTYVLTHTLLNLPKYLNDLKDQIALKEQKKKEMQAEGRDPLGE